MIEEKTGVTNRLKTWRDAARDPVQRERINLLLKQMQNFEKAEGEQRAALAANIKRQAALIQELR